MGQNVIDSLTNRIDFFLNENVRKTIYIFFADFSILILYTFLILCIKLNLLIWMTCVSFITNYNNCYLKLN